MPDPSEIAERPLRFFLLTTDEKLASVLQSLWPEDQVEWTVFSGGNFVFEHIFNNPPDMVIASRDMPGLCGIDVLRMLKEENIYRQICAVLALDGENVGTLADAEPEVDELLILPSTPQILRTRIELALRRSSRTLDANPLTRLPGNTSIINTLRRLLRGNGEFALAYADMDHFKPYNDKYGFSRGDEALLMTARLIVNTVGSMHCEPSFVGHVGGDDFVFILPPDAAEDACKRLIDSFDAIVPSFYDPEDRRRGAILSHDRQGREQFFPIMGLSIAVVPNRSGKYTHYAQLSHVAGQLKKTAKATAGSNYVIDRRA
jgi:GGDEF domain-containing protein